uniref:hypothetical protein n=1 Tax=Falsiroseomonas oryzae TaxID=2766473 RepID=UPI0022EB8E05
MPPAQADETVVLRPRRPALPPQPPLRDAVLAGAFFGDRHAEAAGRVAGFARSGSAADAVRDWFGA